MDHGFQQRQVKTISPGLLLIFGRVVTSTGGTIASTDIPGGGVAVTKTGSEVGRYTFAVTDAADTALTGLRFVHLDVTVIGPDDTAMTDAKGVGKVIRDIDIGAGADDGTVEVQFQDADSAADAELQDGAEFTFMLVLGHKDCV